MVATEQQLAGHRVQYAGRTYAGGQTSFSYLVTAQAGSGTLSHFVVQIPGCAGTLASYAPTSASASTGYDPYTGLDGLTWGNLSLGTGQSQTFTLTFPGNVIEGLTRVGVKAGSTVGIGVLPGPCGGFVISGTVFDDPDSSGTRNADSELGVPNATVSIVAASGAVETVLSGPDGRYSLRVVDGAYIVRIDDATAASDFNEELALNFNATRPTSVSVTGGPDRPNVDFGFKPRTRKIITDFSVGALVSTGQDAGYWTKLLRSSSRGQSYDGISAAGARALLLQIEGEFLPSPYQFTDGNEIAEALAVVATRPKTVYDALYRYLLIAELNDASGKGLTANPGLQKALLAWGESLAFQNQPAALITAAGTTTSSPVRDAAELFGAFNNERGGGDIPQ